MTTARSRTVAVVALVALTYAFAAISLWRVLQVEMAGSDLDDVLNTAGFGTAFLGLPAVGAVLTIHRPQNPIGRTLLWFGGGMYLMLFVGSSTELADMRTGVVDGPLLWTAGLVSAAAPLLLWLMVHLLLYFPNGELTGRSRWISRLATGVLVLLVLIRLVRPAMLDAVVAVPNPYGQAWAAPVAWLVGPLTFGFACLAVVALLRLVARYRMAGSPEQAQFRWILASLVCIPTFLAAGILVDILVGDDLLVTVIIIGGYNLGALGFSYALYRAVTRRDLYGIGRVLSRSVSYAVVVAVLVATYLGLVVGLGAVARLLTGESGDLVVAVSTLAVAGLFQPLRRRTREVVDRRFNRARYDAARTVDAFGRGLRDQLGLGAIVGELQEVAALTFEPASAGVVLVGREGRS